MRRTTTISLARLVFVAILIHLTAAPPRSASANTFQMQDSNIIDTLAKKILNAEGDNISVIRSLIAAHRFEEIECLSEIGHDLASLHYELS
jgi:hypothetical protein